MRVTLDLSEDLARLLGDDSTELNRGELEALALEGLRAGKLSIALAGRLLGLASRYKMDGFLKSHGIMLPVTIRDIERDADPALRFQSQ